MSLTQALRRFRFFLLEKIVLPITIVPLKLLIRTWRLRPPDQATLPDTFRPPRLVTITYHGMLLHVLAFSHLAAAHQRRLVVMLSPSLDGRLLGRFLAYFGIDHVRATTDRRGVLGSLEFIRRIEAGDIGLIAADGPRGPCCVAKAGALRIAAAARAQVLLAVTSAQRGITFGSWDRQHLPAPFAHVELSLQLTPVPTANSVEQAAASVQQTLLDTARRMRSPVLPPALQNSPPKPHVRLAS